MQRLATPILGLDYTSPIAGAHLRAMGVKFVARYCSNYPWKNLSHAEAMDLKAHGISIVTVWEDGAQDMLLGYNVGRLHAQQHLAMSNACGRPKNHGYWYFAGDYDTAGHPEYTNGYADGVASVLPKERCGPYGDGELIDHWMNRGFGCGWQARSAYAWAGNSKDDTRAQIIQYQNDPSWDWDHAYYADFGQWDYVKPPPPDNHHYERFPDTPFHLNGKEYNEQLTVKMFDEREPHFKDDLAMHVRLRHELGLMRGRIYSVAHQDLIPLAMDPFRPAAWNTAWRGWRFQEIDRRLFKEA